MRSCILTAILCLALAGCSREPVYNGKPLHQWVSLLQDENFDTSGTPNSMGASNAVRTIGPAAVPWLVEWTTHPGSNVVETPPAFRILGLQAASAIPELAEFLDHNRTNTDAEGPWVEAATAISYLGPGAIPCMLAAATNKGADQKELIQDFGHLGTNGVSVIPKLIAWTSDSNSDVRVGAFNALGAIAMEPETVVPLLRLALKDPDPLVRREAANSLGSFGTAAKDAQPDLIQMLSDQDGQARDNAIGALGKIGGDHSVVLPYLVKALNDPDSGARLMAALSLGDVGGPKAFDALMLSTDDKDKDVRAAVFRSLKKIDPVQFAKSGKSLH
ncbi:MAG TPA: HEAT repeat domain-containing protein [Verrucomicrobiae bacterium]|jgi:hypothetical protein|nr:HEAT repeat domain-containing protein [Verrucomicrobiae bacterium]